VVLWQLTLALAKVPVLLALPESVPKLLP